MGELFHPRQLAQERWSSCAPRVERSEHLAADLAGFPLQVADVASPSAVRWIARLRRSSGCARRSARPRASSSSSTATIERGSTSEDSARSCWVRPGCAASTAITPKSRGCSPCGSSTAVKRSRERAPSQFRKNPVNCPSSAGGRSYPASRVREFTPRTLIVCDTNDSWSSPSPAGSSPTAARRRLLGPRHARRHRAVRRGHEGHGPEVLGPGQGGLGRPTWRSRKALQRHRRQRRPAHPRRHPPRRARRRPRSAGAAGCGSRPRSRGALPGARVAGYGSTGDRGLRLQGRPHGVRRRLPDARPRPALRRQPRRPRRSCAPRSAARRSPGAPVHLTGYDALSNTRAATTAPACSSRRSSAASARCSCSPSSSARSWRSCPLLMAIAVDHDLVPASPTG